MSCCKPSNGCNPCDPWSGGPIGNPPLVSRDDIFIFQGNTFLKHIYLETGFFSIDTSEPYFDGGLLKFIGDHCFEEGDRLIIHDHVGTEDINGCHLVQGIQLDSVILSTPIYGSGCGGYASKAISLDGWSFKGQIRANYAHQTLYPAVSGTIEAGSTEVAVFCSGCHTAPLKEGCYIDFPAAGITQALVTGFKRNGNVFCFNLDKPARFSARQCPIELHTKPLADLDFILSDTCGAEDFFDFMCGKVTMHLQAEATYRIPINFHNCVDYCGEKWFGGYLYQIIGTKVDDRLKVPVSQTVAEGKVWVKPSICQPS